MEHERFENWLRNIYNTQEEEISCSDCFELVSGYAQLDATGQDAASQLPQVKQHLDQCQACREEYETLRDILRLEDEGGIPSTDDLQEQIP